MSENDLIPLTCSRNNFLLDMAYCHLLLAEITDDDQCILGYIELQCIILWCGERQYHQLA